MTFLNQMQVACQSPINHIHYIAQYESSIEIVNVKSLSVLVLADTSRHSPPTCCEYKRCKHSNDKRWFTTEKRKLSPHESILWIQRLSIYIPLVCQVCMELSLNDNSISTFAPKSHFEKKKCSTFPHSIMFHFTVIIWIMFENVGIFKVYHGKLCFE